MQDTPHSAGFSAEKEGAEHSCLPLDAVQVDLTLRILCRLICMDSAGNKYTRVRAT